MRELATGTLGIEKLLAITSPQNTSSARLLERLGFVTQGQMPWTGGSEDPVTVYAYAR